MLHRLHYKYLESYLTVYQVLVSKPLESTKLSGSKGGKQTRTKSQAVVHEQKAVRRA